MDFVFTVCDNAVKAQGLWDTAGILKRRIQLMLALPLAALDRLAIQREVRDIGSR